MNDPHLKEDKAQITHKLIEYFREEREEEIGELAAGMLLDFIEREIGPFFYNRGVRDAKLKATAVVATLTEELDFLEQLVPKKPAKKK
jgi:uncharacterized protein (DUF2164 family)